MKTFLSPLTIQEEKQYLKQLGEGSLEAKHILIEHNMRLVAHVVKKYQNVEEDMEDLISIGTIGLIKAIDTFLLMYLRSKRKIAREVSLYEPIGTDKEGNQIHLLDIVEHNEPDVVEQMEYDRNVKTLYEILPRVLNRREQIIINLRYGLKTDCPVTQKEIAKNLNISRSYVSRIEKRALEKLKAYFEKGYNY